ncbi:MAG TPA: SdrD B-like domain-containing protein, partial [Anaerolineae bacterium]
TTTPKLNSWFEFYGRGSSIYQITTLNVQPGVETVITVYKPVSNIYIPNLVLVSPLPGYSNPNNRYIAGSRGSQTSFQVPNGADGLYWIQVSNIDPSPRVNGQNYSLQVQEVLQVATPGPSPTPTPLGPTPTPFPGAPDRFEYNGDFDHATLIAPNVKYDNLNFVPYHPLSENDTDNDYYKLPVKQGIFYTCQTLDLAPGVDTNIIIYNQDRVGIGGNDDISLEERLKGNFASRFSWLASYTGNAYMLVGEVNPPRASEAGGHTYSLRCDIGLPATATPIPTSTSLPGVVGPVVNYVPPTPLPPEPTMTPFPTPRSAQNLPVRQINASTPTPVQQPTATPRIVTVNVQVFNDINRNGLLDPGEGITGVSVRLVDEQTGIPLAQTLSDADGRVAFSTTNPGPVRLSVPLFGYSALFNEPSVTVRIAVISDVTLPTRLP